MKAVFGILILMTGSAVAAQDPFINLRGDMFGIDSVPRIRVGTMIGRDGAAFGPGLIVEYNPIRALGLYGFAGRSSVNNYDAGDGIKANFSDRTLGFGLEYRAIKVGRFTFGAFAEASYYSSNVHASYFDPEYGATVQYVSTDRDHPLVTTGPSIDWNVGHGISIVIRPGKDFGNNIAGSTANGVSVKAGVLIDVSEIGKAFKKIPH